MGLVGILLKSVAAIVLIVVGLGAYLYFTDYEAQATITDRSDRSPCFIVVTPKIAPWIDHRTDVSCDHAKFVCEGYDVTYRLQTKAFSVRDDAGRTVYDSQNPRLPLANILDCDRL